MTGVGGSFPVTHTKKDSTNLLFSGQLDRIVSTGMGHTKKSRIYTKSRRLFQTKENRFYWVRLEWVRRSFSRLPRRFRSSRVLHSPEGLAALLHAVHATGRPTRRWSHAACGLGETKHPRRAGLGGGIPPDGYDVRAKMASHKLLLQTEKTVQLIFMQEWGDLLLKRLPLFPLFSHAFGICLQDPLCNQLLASHHISELFVAH